MNLILTWTTLSLSSRCHQCASVCAVCHHVVKGMFVWCQGCSHGGHLEHIMNWLKSSAHCPAGCGHLCEYTWAHQKHRSHSWCSVGVGTGPHTSLDLFHTHHRQTGCLCSPTWDWSDLSPWTEWRVCLSQQGTKCLCALLDSHSRANSITFGFILVLMDLYISRCYSRYPDNITIFLWIHTCCILHFFFNPEGCAEGTVSSSEVDC